MVKRESGSFFTPIILTFLSSFRFCDGQRYPYGYTKFDECRRTGIAWRDGRTATTVCHAFTIDGEQLRDGHGLDLATAVFPCYYQQKVKEEPQPKEPKPAQGNGGNKKRVRVKQESESEGDHPGKRTRVVY